MTPDTLDELREIFAPLADDIDSEPWSPSLGIEALIRQWEAA